MTTIIDTYRPGDEKRIIELFSRVFKKNIDINHWRWEHMDNPRGKSHFALLKEDKTICGHLCLHQALFNYNGYTCAAGQRIKSMLDKNYRHQGYYSLLLEKLEEEATGNNMAFTYSFPNNDALKALQKIHPAAQVAQIPRYIKFYRGRSAADKFIKQSALAKAAGILLEVPLAVKNRRKVSTAHVIPLASFDERVNSLWEITSQYFTIANIRNQDYLNWRFINSPFHYHALAYIEKEAMLGYIILHIDKEGTGHIVDLLAVNNDKVLPALLSAADDFMAPQCDILSCWCLDQGQYSYHLKQQGFFCLSSRNTLAVAGGANCPPELREALLKKNSWFVTIGDSDYI